MRKISLINIYFLAGLACLVFACKTTQYPAMESVNTDKLYGDTLVTDTSSLAGKHWNEIFADTVLQGLITEGLNNNFDLRIAIQREKEAEAYFKQSGAQLLPGISAGASDSYSHNSESINKNGPVESNVVQMGFQASWELDIWGKLRSYKRAAYADLLASDAGRRAVQTRLISDIATTYYYLVALDAKMAIATQTVQNNIDLVETMRRLQASGKVTGAAIVQAEATRYSAEVIIPDLKQQILVTQNTLSHLLGRTGGPINRGSLDGQLVTPLMTIGVPASLLDNRPDVLQARYEVMSAYEITKGARRYFYPAITLSGSAGLAAVALDELLNPTSFASNLVAGLTQPVFQKKANITRLKVARAQQEEALLNFKSVLFNAGNEVQNALGSYQASVQKINLRVSQIEALNNSVNFSKELLTYGSANYTEVLYAQQSLLSAQLNSVDDQVQKLDAVVSLYRALGGGWR